MKKFVKAMIVLAVLVVALQVIWYLRLLLGMAFTDHLI